MSIKLLGKGLQMGKKVQAWVRLKRVLPRLVANNSLNHYLQGFRQGGGQTDEGKWQARKRGAPRDTSRNILVDTGALRRDIRIRRTTFRSIIIGTARIAYARRHNEGLDMPKREFLGESKELDKKNTKLVTKRINKIMK